MRKLIAALVLAGPLAAAGAELPIFDAHLHYSHDAWEVLPPKDVAERIAYKNGEALLPPQR